MIGGIGRYWSNEEKRLESEFYVLRDKVNEENLRNFNNYFKTDEDKGNALNPEKNKDKEGIVINNVPFYMKAIRANQNIPRSKPRTFKVYKPRIQDASLTAISSFQKNYIDAIGNAKTFGKKRMVPQRKNQKPNPRKHSLCQVPAEEETH